MKVTIKADSKTGRAKIKWGKKTTWLGNVSIQMKEHAADDEVSNSENFSRIIQVPTARTSVFIDGIVRAEATPDNVIPFPRKVA